MTCRNQITEPLSINEKTLQITVRALLSQSSEGFEDLHSPYVVILGTLKALTISKKSLQVAVTYASLACAVLSTTRLRKGFSAGVLCSSGVPDQVTGHQKTTQFLHLT